MKGLKKKVWKVGGYKKEATQLFEENLFINLSNYFIEKSKIQIQYN